MTDLFEEVEDELRRDQYMKAARKAAPWAIGALVGALLIGGGIVGYATFKNRSAENASQSYDAALKIASQGDMEGAFNAFGEIAGKGPAIYRYMALSHQAGIRAQQQRTEDAVALLDKAAGEAPGGDAGELVSDFAALKAAWLLIDTAPYDQIETRLKPLIEDERPFRANALFTLGVAKLKAGRKDEARADFNTLSTMLGAPEPLTQSAQVAVELIDSGAGEVLGQVITQATALPSPQFELTPEMLQQLMQQQGAQGGAAQ